MWHWWAKPLSVAQTRTVELGFCYGMWHWWAKPLSVAQTSIDELHLGCGTDQHALDQEIPRALLSPFDQSESQSLQSIHVVWHAESCLQFAILSFPAGLAAPHCTRTFAVKI